MPKAIPLEYLLAEPRFWRFVRKCEDGCWKWLGSFSPSSGSNSKWPYGSFALVATVVGRRIIKAHRYSYILHRGLIPEKVKVLHRCDNTLCVNPDHLFLGSQKDNMEDCVAKGRIATKANGRIAINLKGSSHWINDPEKKAAWHRKRWPKERREAQRQKSLKMKFWKKRDQN